MEKVGYCLKGMLLPMKFFNSDLLRLKQRFLGFILNRLFQSLTVIHFSLHLQAIQQKRL